MKVFFDRFTDLLVDPDNREIGRALSGRNVWLLATGTDENLPLGFQEPFAQTSSYFGMVWQQAFYCQSVKDAPFSADSISKAEKLVALILN